MGNSLYASKLDLSNRGLTEVPLEVLKYKNLKTLKLSNNKITSLPKELCRLKQLRNFDLSNNKISSLFSKTFELKNLEVLALNNNRLSALPKQIGNLTKLKKLSLAGNPLEGLPDEIAKLSNLQSLNIANNLFKEFPSQILALKQLRRLWLGNNNFAYLPIDDISSKLENLKGLYTYNTMMNHNSRTDEAYAFLQSFRGNAVETLKLITYSNSTANSYMLRKPAETLKHIFISYSHADAKSKDAIVTYLRGLQYLGLEFEFWSDDELHSGDEWEREIDQALERAGIAIFIASPDFMASRFIQKVELPRLLKKAESEGTKLLTVIARKCHFHDSHLSKYQAVNSPNTPLNALKDWEQDAVLYKLGEEVKRHVTVRSQS